MIISMISSVLLLIALIMMFLSNRSLHKAFVSNSQALLALNQRIKHLYLLNFITSKSLPMIIQQSFMKLYNTDPNTIPPEKQDIVDIILKASIQDLLKYKKQMLSGRNVLDLTDRQKIDSYVTEIDGIVNLYETVDEHSSQEFKNQVMENIYASVNKIYYMTKDPNLE